MSAGLPLVAEDADPAVVLTELLAAGHGDGLPVVPPTASRVAAMLAGTAAPDEVHGQVPPLFGDLTVRSVAWYAVLAGCRPAELPLVATAVRAALAPGFNLLGIATTTGAPAVGVLVHGGLAAELGMTAGAGGLGTGTRANACTGRAVSLALSGIGGARAGTTDMSTLGSPAKVGCCTAESPAGPWPSLAVRRGLSDGAAAVTVHGVGSLLEVLPGEGYRTAADVLAPAAGALAGVAVAAGDPHRAGGTEHLLLVPPELAGFLADRGWGAERVADHLVRHGSQLLRWLGGDPGLSVAASPGGLQVVVSGGAGVKMQLLPGWAGGTRSVTVPVVAW